MATVALSSAVTLLEAVGNLKIRSCFGRVSYVVKRAKEGVLFVDVGLRLPFLGFLIKGYADYATGVIFAKLHIPAIFRFRNGPDVINPIIQRVAVNVVDVSRPFAISKHPSKSVGVNGRSMDSSEKVPAQSHCVEATISKELCVPSEEGSVCCEEFSSGLLPEKKACIRLVQNPLFKVFWREQINWLRHLRPFCIHTPTWHTKEVK